MASSIWLVNFDPTTGSEIKETRPTVILAGIILECDGRSRCGGPI
ncbi:MAG: hypothetical protein EXS31_12115 [Pedosphaera sp.]|nr:hypothetical protein [Pedosphaera sp.]